MLMPRLRIEEVEGKWWVFKYLGCDGKIHHSEEIAGPFDSADEAEQAKARIHSADAALISRS